jgi:hypothetical protein
MRRDSWDEFIIEGDALFDYMKTHFQLMFNGDFIKHFNIIPGLYTSFSHTEEITEKYGQDIQKNLTIWLRKEFKMNNLFEKKDWKPFRDPSMYSCMYLGYRKFFVYNDYYFQVAVEPECSNCNYCENNENPIHFELVYYGYRENNESSILQPYGYIEILENNIISEDYWNIK